jgi:hypothetical protein
MVGARQPERGDALHAPVPYLYVLQTVVERMSQVEDTGYIGRRNYDGKGLLLPVYFRLKMALALPHLVHALFERLWVIGLGKLHRFHVLLQNEQKVHKRIAQKRVCREGGDSSRKSPRPLFITLVLAA